MIPYALLFPCFKNDVKVIHLSTTYHFLIALPLSYCLLLSFLFWEAIFTLREYKGSRETIILITTTFVAKTNSIIITVVFSLKVFILPRNLIGCSLEVLYEFSMISLFVHMRILAAIGGTRTATVGQYTINDCLPHRNIN